MTTESNDTSPPPPAGLVSPRRRLATRIATIAAVAVALLALAYGIGRAQGAHEVSRVEAAAHATQTRAEGAVRDLRAQLTAREGDLARTRHAVAQLEGRRQLGLALLSLDQRNFGIAQGQIDAARAALQGADDPGLADVTGQLVGLSIVAAGDFADQRARVLAIARAFDQHLPGAAPSR